MTVPEDLRLYLTDLVECLRSVLDDRLVAVYVLGGVALGDYRAGSSDLDVYAVVSTTLNVGEKRSVAAACGHDGLPCPARKLELVLVHADVALHPGPRPRWELNLNTGRGIPEHVGLDPAAEPSHWFVIDLALACQTAMVLYGPPPCEVIGTPDPADVCAAQRDVVSWYRERDMYPDAVVAALRAWHWLETGRFAGKRQAVLWAAARI